MIKQLDVGLKRVRVHWNFHRKEFSICQNGRVVGYAKCIWLHNVEFKVGVKGRERVIREGVKNVHAYVYGDLYLVDDTNNHWYKNHETTVRYNPYEYSSFVDELDQPIYNARNVMLNAVDGKARMEAGF